MNVKIRILLAIFLFLLAVVAGVRLWPRPQAPELRLAGWGPDRKTERAEEDAPVDRIDLGIGDATTVLTREGDAWRMSTPVGATADRAKVRQILEGLREDLVSLLGSPTGADEATFGLDPAHRVRVTLKRDGAVVADLEIGTVRDPDTGGSPGDTFVRLPGTGRAWRILDRNLRRPFEDGVPGLRDRRILPVEAGRVVAMTVTDPQAADPLDRRIVLESDAPAADAGTGEPWPAGAPASRTWRIAAPQGYAAGDVDRLAGALAGLWAQEWADAPPEGVDLGPEAYTLLATLDDGATRTLRLSPVRDDAAWVAVDGVPGVAKVSRHAAESLRKRLGDLRDKSPLGWPADRIAEVALVDGDRAWHFARRGNDFTSLRPAGMALGRAALESLVGDVARLKVERFVPTAEAPDAQTGLDSPEGQLAVTATDGTRRVLLLGRTEGGRTWLRVDGSPEAATIAPWMLEKIRREARTFRNRTVFAFEPGDIARIRIAHPDEELVLAARPDAPPDAPAFAIEGTSDVPRAEAVVALVATLAGLTARDFPKDAPPRLGRPDLRIGVTLRDGSAHTLQIAGQDRDGNPYGLAPGAAGFGKAVFTLSPVQVEKLRLRRADLVP